MPSDLHVIFGAGQVGTPLARRLLAAGKRVRVVKRSPGGVAAGAEPRPDEPFVVDDRRFRERFGAQPAGLENAARATLAWAHDAYGRRNA